MKRAALHNLGCKVNAYETEAMEALLAGDGYEIVPFDEKADVYVINTCSVTSMADHKSRQMIHRARKKNPDAVVIAAGCYVQTGLESLKKDLSVDIILGNNKKDELIPELHRFLKDHDRELDVIDVNQGHLNFENLYLTRTAEHTRAFLKVQDGCDQFCSYCVIPFARGRIRSRAIEEVVAETEQLAKQGYREFVLTGIHLSSYGMARYGVPGPYGLQDLIEAVAAVDGVERVRLGSVEPQIFTGDFIERISKVPEFCPHFHLSLQSGCNRILKAMNRKYTAEEYEETCHQIRKYFDHPAITTDVIVGFPGETEEDYEESRAFVERIRFYELHVFKFSRRKGTRADTMPDQIPEEIKTKRSRDLIAIGKQMSKEFREEILGSRQEILAEEKMEINGRSYWTGYTKEYVRMAYLSDENLQNRLISGLAGSMLTDEIVLLDRDTCERVR
ncbi:MAG: tRNA (N(6)-L-threonylcarbamoyladenosine(37)-C(2))-methylthiotransferase MtaB [Lachnospiraceae bacterium]|nr:tRNA (N(6)-L-threonylcarbamoyladenosine(37)-C(2))-methylthiotransferase MtaB [Lachnospiraceae bacterium]